jgi:hypothetical protein
LIVIITKTSELSKQNELAQSPLLGKGSRQATFSRFFSSLHFRVRQLRKEVAGWFSGKVARQPDPPTRKLLHLDVSTFFFKNTLQRKLMLSIAFSESKYYVNKLSENI